jgi:NAD+ kinase
VPQGSNVYVRRSGELLLARLSQAPFTDRLVSKFDLPVAGWRERAVRSEASEHTFERGEE